MKTAKRVLLVEDDEDDQVFFKAALERIHPQIECTIACNGEEALAAIDIPPSYDIIFMDLNMPVMNGYECIKKLKEGEYKHVPIVVLSTSRALADVERCKKLGAGMYCVKPTSLDKLFEELSTIVKKGVVFHLS